MRLPFLRASKPAFEPTGPARGKAGSAAAGSVKDALGLPGDGPQQAARTGARKRLMGAAVLLAVGVIGFPMLFETQPRPLPVDLPFLLPEGSGRKLSPATSAATLPKPPPDAGVESGPVGPAAVAPAVAAVAAVSASASGASNRPVNSASAAGAASAAAAPTPAKPASTALAPARVAQAAVKASAPNPAVAEAASPVPAASRPAAALQSQPAAVEAAAGSGRFVVQVGAYNDAERLRAARQKLEKLGLKSYTQDVDTPSGKRTRVRVGPFPSRKEADAVAAKVKASGMQANILAL